MKTIKDIEEIPKKLLNSKKISLYKAFIFTDDDEEMNIDVNADILSLSIDDAIKHLIQSLPLPIIEAIKGMFVSIAIFSFEKDELLNKPLVDEGDIFYKDGSLSITLKDKVFKVDVKDVTITEFAYDVDPKTEIKNVIELKYDECK